MRNKIIILSMMILILGINLAQASQGNVFNPKGEIIDNKAFLDIYPQQFKDKTEADTIAKELQNGQVFQDHDTKLYQILYGNVIIIGCVQVSSYSEK